MKKDWKYILYVSLAIGLFVLVKLLSPKQYNWSVTLAHDDKEPYGTYALNKLLPTIFHENNINHSYKTLYELKDSLRKDDNLVIFTTTFSPEKEDAHALLNHVSNGGTVFISAHSFWGILADTLNLGTHDYFFTDGDITQRKDTSFLKFVNLTLDTTARYFYRRDNIHRHFDRFDTTRTTVIARNDFNQPATIRMRWGKGNLILNSTPLAFTNIYLLSKENNNFVSQSLSYLPNQNVQWTEFYHLGRMEASTPLRFILTNEPLRWAYFITLLSILIFMIFEAKRKQRIIPVIKPLANTTLEFVSTIGNLYYQSRDHKNIAEKKINFLLEQIRTKYLLKTNQLDDNFLRSLALKSGKREESVRSLFKTITFIQQAIAIYAEQLIDLNDKIEDFNNHH